MFRAEDELSKDEDEVEELEFGFIAPVRFDVFEDLEATPHRLIDNG